LIFDDIVRLTSPAVQEGNGMDVPTAIRNLQRIEPRRPEIRPPLEDMIFVLKRLAAAAPNMSPDKPLTAAELKRLHGVGKEAEKRLGSFRSRQLTPNRAKLDRWDDRNCH
jgi:hypothetical protein